MSGNTNLYQLLEGLNPSLCDQEFVFICQSYPAMPNDAEQHAFAVVRETEGLTLVIPKQVADNNSYSYSVVFRRITLQVYSSLEAVGLTAAISTQLLRLGISANVIAGFHHDHVFVPSTKANDALHALQALRSRESPK